MRHSILASAVLLLLPALAAGQTHSIAGFSGSIMNNLARDAGREQADLKAQRGRYIKKFRSMPTPALLAKMAAAPVLADPICEVLAERHGEALGGVPAAFNAMLSRGGDVSRGTMLAMLPVLGECGKEGTPVVQRIVALNMTRSKEITGQKFSRSSSLMNGPSIPLAAEAAFTAIAATGDKVAEAEANDLFEARIARMDKANKDAAAAAKRNANLARAKIHQAKNKKAAR